MLQGFDTYGIGAYDGVPAPNLTKALGLKVCSRTCLDGAQQPLPPASSMPLLSLPGRTSRLPTDAAVPSRWQQLLQLLDLHVLGGPPQSHKQTWAAGTLLLCEQSHNEHRMRTASADRAHESLWWGGFVMISMAG